jgi:hypothetical protein
MPTNAFRISATALLALLLFGCAPSSSGPNGITSGFQDALAPLNPQAYQTVKETEARKRYEQSSADYRACLAANQAVVQVCEAKRLIMETDERDVDRFIQR